MVWLDVVDAPLLGQHLYTKIAKIVNKIKHATPRKIYTANEYISSLDGPVLTVIPSVFTLTSKLGNLIGVIQKYEEEII